MKKFLLLSTLMLLFIAVGCEQNEELLPEPEPEPKPKPEPTITNPLTPLDTGTVNDTDGNVYSTVIIGTQEWMQENLNTTKYANGDLIPKVLYGPEWNNLTTGAWCHYDNDSIYETPYGKLYNWYTVDDSRNLCPSGWHVPTDAEWTTLTDYLGGEQVAGGKMKAVGTIQAGTGLWNDPNTGATNESGFTGLPGGYRNSNGYSNYIGYYGSWWSSSQDSIGDAWIRDLNYDDNEVVRYNDYKEVGCSVRCLRD